MAAGAAPRRVGVVVKGWPRLSETFVAQELVGLEDCGVDLALFSLRHPTDRKVHALNRRLKAPVTYLPEYLHEEPLRVLRALARTARWPGWRKCLAAWLRDLARDRTRNRIRRFGQALVLAREMPEGIDWLYAHFLHTPASVARYASLLRGIPWSASAHAKDIWTTPDWDLREKLAEARWAVTCTAAGRSRLAALAPAPDRVELVHHGLDFSRFPPAPTERPRRDGTPTGGAVRVLSVGRAVPKKGFDTALKALARLPADLDWRWSHVGGGGETEGLRALAAELKLSGRVEWLGAQSHDVVLALYAGSDLFLLPSRVAEDGDRDGIPNVLMEAQVMGLPIVATRVASIPELLEDGRTAALVEPEDPAALAAALARLARDPARRARLAEAARARVLERFAAEPGIRRIAALLGHAAAAEPERLAS